MSLWLQAYMNFIRQSTKGWSVGFVFLDITGGICSLLQMFIIAYNGGRYSAYSWADPGVS